MLKIIPLLIFAFFGFCRDDVSKPQDHPTLSYTLNLSALHPDSLTISFTTDNIPQAGGRFILPAHHFDNPIDSFSSTTAADLHITDRKGNPLNGTFSEEQLGPITNQIFTAHPDAQYPLTFSYTFDPSAIAQPSHILPHMHLDNSALLMGSYLFIVPYLTDDLARLWRTPLDIELNVTAPASVDLHGVPPHSTYRNIYELFFTQLTAGAQEIARGSGGGQDFVVLNLSGESYDNSYTPEMMERVPHLLDEAVVRFGTIRSQDAPFTISVTGTVGALEGYNGFTLLTPTPDNHFIIYMVIAHEIIHHFVGIRCGDYDDPWWKEGTTNYLGIALSARLGYFSKEHVHSMLLGEKDFSDPKFSHALSDPHVRSHHFKEDFFDLIYTKGMWVSMLMDERIRRATDNRIILDDLVAELCMKFDGSAFYRQDYVDLFKKYGADVGDLFSSYVDTQESIPHSELERAYSYLDSAGAFGNPGGEVSFASGKPTLLKKF
ncbi:MAG: hypothetical protein ACOCXC_01360 [Fibrobacterota bacterium]